MKKSLSLVLGFFLFSIFSIAQEKGKEFPIEYFFRKEKKTKFTVSPDGERVAYLGEWKGRYNLFVEPINGGEATQMTFFNEQDVVTYYWGDNYSIALERSGSAGVHSAVFLASLTSGNLIELSSSSSPAHLISDGKTRAQILFTSANGLNGVNDVYQAGSSEGVATKIYSGNGNEISYCIGAEGNLTAVVSANDDFLALSGSGIGGKGGKYVVLPLSEKLIPVMSSPSIKSDHLFITYNGKNRLRMVSVALNESGRMKEVFGNDDSDVVGIACSAVTKKFFGIEYEKGQEFNTHILDDMFGDVYSAVRKGVSQELNIRFVNCDDKENIFVFKAWSSRQRAMYYRYNLANRELKEMGQYSESSMVEFFAKRQTFKFKTQDQAELTGYLSEPVWNQGNIPLVVLVRDFPWVRDCNGFDPLIQFLTSKGFAVYEAAFRGSAGQGRAYEESGYLKWGTQVQSDILDGIRALQRSGKFSIDKFAVIGQGFGGFSAMMQAANPESGIACAVSIDGFFDLHKLLSGTDSYSPQGKAGDNLIIGNPDNDADMLKLKSPLAQASNIQIPVMIAYGDANGQAIEQNEPMFSKLNQLGIVYDTYAIQGENFGITIVDNQLSFYDHMLNFLNKSFSTARSQKGRQ